MTFEETEKLKKLLKSRLKLISLVNLQSGEEQIALIDKSIWSKTIENYYKRGYISEKLFDDNFSSIINKWDILGENIKDFKAENKELRAAVIDYDQMLKKIETDPFYSRAYADSKKGFIERKQKAEGEIKKNKELLRSWIPEFNELNAKVEEIRNRFLKLKDEVM